MTQTKVTAAVIIIGNEILSGRTQDKNLAFLANILNENGVQIREAKVIPDIESTIIDCVRDYSKNFDYVITTGGIGPTHDDITSESIANAFGMQLVMDKEIEKMIRSRPATEAEMKSRLKMAMIPQGAELVRTSFGPPGFRLNNIFVLAGIPRVMEEMSKSMVKMIRGGSKVESRSLDVFLTESAIASPLEEIQKDFPDLDLGSYPFVRDGKYGTSLVIRGSNVNQLNEAFERVRNLKPTS